MAFPQGAASDAAATSKPTDRHLVEDGDTGLGKELTSQQLGDQISKGYNSPFTPTKGDIIAPPVLGGLYGWNVVNGATLTAETQYAAITNASIRINPSSDSEQGAYYNYPTGHGITLTKQTPLTVWVGSNWHSTSLSANDIIRVYLYDDYQEGGGTTNQYSYIDFQMSKCVKQKGVTALTILGEWVDDPGASIKGYTADQTSFVAGAGGHYSGTYIDRIEVQVLGNPGNDVWLGGVTAGAWHKPTVLMYFDDGSDDLLTTTHSGNGGAHYTGMNVKEMMAYNGWKGMIGVIRDNVGQTNYLTRDEIDSFYQAGWDVHTHGAEELTGGSTVFDDVQQAVYDGYPSGTKVNGDGVLYNRQYLLDQGWTRAANHYAYPLNAVSASGEVAFEELTALLSQEGFLTARTSWPNVDGFQMTDVAPDQGLMAFPGVTVSSDSANMAATWAELRDRTIDSLLVNGGITVPLIFHLFTTTASPGGTLDTGTECYIEDFGLILDRLKAYENRGLMQVMTITDYYTESQRILS